MRLKVNGASYELAPAGHETLLTVLRDRLQLTGTKLVCGRGECGACTVLLEEADGASPRSAYACLTLAAACDGHSVTTVEGLGQPGALHPLQQAFVEHDALQCGFCTPGQLLAAAALLARTPEPSAEDVRRGMSGNLCRCGAYPRIVQAVVAAGRRMAEAKHG
ncbi:MAG: (2Fe-2S)-binding protein [Gemmatimonadota bacterium]|nr:(2Fe-2S)-binding protein [Gemmatimonadota bacterium]